VGGHKHNFVSLRIPDVNWIWTWQLNYVKLLEMNSFFTLHIFLKVGKTQDLSSKIWQTLGDALTCRLLCDNKKSLAFCATFTLSHNKI
jgi:hypothetical protein